MKSLHKIAALLTAFLLGTVMFTGCMDESVTIQEEELPYGSTMREAKTTYALPVSYDRRFVSEAQLTAITDYLAAIQNSDGDAYAANTFDFYADYQLNEVYAGQYADMDEMIGALRASMAEVTADDFEFTMINISDFTQERVTSGLNTMIEVLTKVSGDDSFSETIDNCWAVEMEWQIKYNGGQSSVLVSEERLFLFEVDGAYYCVL